MSRFYGLPNIVEFEQYILECTNNKPKFYHDYLGIRKSDFPKWQGWKIINKHKENGIVVSIVDDPILNMHVNNFYYLKLIKKRYY
jgi:hypothetical protein